MTCICTPQLTRREIAQGHFTDCPKAQLPKCFEPGYLAAGREKRKLMQTLDSV